MRSLAVRLAGVAAVLLVITGIGFAVRGQWDVAASVVLFGVAIVLKVLAQSAGVEEAWDEEDELDALTGYRRENCPCCGSPTLNARLAITTCPICEWDIAEDAAEQPTLDVAKQNVRQYLTIYSPDAPPAWSVGPADPDEIALKQRLIHLYGQIRLGGERPEPKNWIDALDCEAELRLRENQRVASFDERDDPVQD